MSNKFLICSINKYYAHLTLYDGFRTLGDAGFQDFCAQLRHKPILSQICFFKKKLI